MKTNYLKFKWASIALCMFAMFSLSLASCSDDEEDNSEYHIVTLDEADWVYKEIGYCWGYLEYSEVSDAWVIGPLTQPAPVYVSGADDLGVELVIMNMKEEYKQYANKFVIFKGEAIHKYTLHKKNGTLSYDIYELTLDDIMLFQGPPTPDYLSYVRVDTEVQNQIGTLVYRDYKWYVALADKSVIPELANKSDFDAVYISIESPGEGFQAGMDISYSGKVNSTYGRGYGKIMEFTDGLRVYLFSGIRNYKITEIAEK